MPARKNCKNCDRHSQYIDDHELNRHCMVFHLIILFVTFSFISLLLGIWAGSLWPLPISWIGFAIGAISMWFAYPIWAYFVEGPYASLRLPAFYLAGEYYNQNIWLPLLSGTLLGICAASWSAFRVRAAARGKQTDREVE
jgi:hypothetical protein